MAKSKDRGGFSVAGESGAESKRVLYFLEGMGDLREKEPFEGTGKSGW